MKNYKVTSVHGVYEDDYEQGELEHINSYVLTAEIEADNPRQAVEEYFCKSLFYQFNYNDCERNEDAVSIRTSVMVNKDNEEVCSPELDQWKAGAIKLYSNEMIVYVDEIVGCTLPLPMQVIKTNANTYEVEHYERKDGLYNVYVHRTGNLENTFKGSNCYAIGVDSISILTEEQVINLRYEIG